MNKCLEYKRFVNESDKTMRVADKALILDLDELVSIGLLASVKHIEFLQLKYRLLFSSAFISSDSRPKFFAVFDDFFKR